MNRISITLFLATILSGCDGSAPPPPPPLPARVLPVVTPETALAAPAAEMVLADVPATIVQPPGSRVAVGAPFAGMVQSVRVQPGQAVVRGQLLATLISREALVVAGDLARAEARRQMTGAEAARMRTLAREGVVAGSRADSAVAADAEAAIDAREARRLLARAGADSDGTLRLVAPINGRVASMSIEAGAPVDGMTAPFVIEADGSRWLALQLPERLAGAVRPGMIFLTAEGRRGRLETVAGAIDPATRAFAARGRLDDASGLMAGRLIQVTLLTPAPDGAVIVPMSAIVRVGDEDLVFVKTAKGFAPRTVRRVGAGDPAVITSGLKAGERVATSLLPELRAMASR